MSRKILWAFLALVSCLPVNTVRSEIIISVDVDPTIPGIQSNFEALAGSTVTAGLFMQLTGSTSIATYNFSVEYDRTELAFQSRVESPINLTGLSELDTSNPVETSIGRLRRFDGGTFANGPVGPFGPVRIGELTFSVLAPFGDANDFDIMPGRFEPLFDTFFDNAFNDVTSSVTFNGGSISVAAIPEPTSLSLIGFTLLVGGISRRRR